MAASAWAACETEPPAPKDANADLAVVDATPAGPCGAIDSAYRFASGSATGHADPAGARAAKQARAGVITNLSQVHSPSDVRFPVRRGDYLLANEKIALYIEAARVSDGYNPFGGEVAAIETVGDDGLPRGTSEWAEALLTAGGMVVAPEKVGVLADGSDGGPAIVRSEGVLKVAPFLEGYAALFTDMRPVPAALDYVLAPGAEKVTVRLSIQNPFAEKVNLGQAQIVAFLMNRSASFTPEHGFAPIAGNTAWLGWEAGPHAVAARVAPGLAFNYLAAVEGAQIFTSSGAVMEACQPVSFDYVELVTASPGIDALIQAMRRVDGELEWRAVSGKVTDAGSAAVADAFVHATRMDGSYVSRARTGADGSYVLHLPDETISLRVSARGLPTPVPTIVSAAQTHIDLSVGALATLHVVTTELGSNVALPARVQVIPVAAPIALPESFGADDAGEGRAHLEFTVDGTATVKVFPGDYRVVVSHGYEYEIFDQTITLGSGQVATLSPVLERSVATPGALSSDTHIHSSYSLDSADPVAYKVRGALAEGLELPVSSEHEYVVDFGPVVEELGATAWAKGFASEELSTSTYGHFGLVPMVAKPDAANRGVVNWAGMHPPQIFDEVRKVEGDPALIVNHPLATQAFKGYFADIHFDDATVVGDVLDWSTNFDAVECFNNSDFEDNRHGSVAAWFSLLGSGKRTFTTGASDNHKMTSGPVGYPRTFFLLGTDDPRQVSPSMLRDAIRAGTSTVSGGLYMTVIGPGGIGPGGTVTATGAPTVFDVTVRAPSWIEAKILEVIVDGQTQQTIDLVPSVIPGVAHLYEATVNVIATGSNATHYVVFHASNATGDLAPVHPGRRPFAVSNPIWF